MEQPVENKSTNKAVVWMKKIGTIGFLFFLIKGLIWLAVFFGVASIFD